MAWIIRMPKLGQAMEAGIVQQWLKKEGDRVEPGEVIAVIESEKFTEELEAREGGVLRKILVPEGEAVPPGTPIGIVAGPTEALPEVEPVSPQAEAQAAAPREPSPTSPQATPPAPKRRVKASPAARRLAEEKGVDLAQIEGSGPEGSITREDVEKYLSEPQPQRAWAGPQPLRTPTESRALSPMRRTIAERLGRSYREAVHVTLFKKVDCSKLLEVRERLNRQRKADLSPLDFIIMAVVRALEQHPELNAVFEDGKHKLIRERNIGIAVDIEKGLITPVLHKAEGKDIFEISRARRELVQKALSGRYTPEDLSGGTFTITNLGPYGIDAFTPIINPPEVAILGVGRIQEEAVRDEREEGGIRFKPFLTFSLTFDHRVVDGAAAARFLETLEEHLREPRGLIPNGKEE